MRSPGVWATRGLEIDHIEDWHDSFKTALELLCWLCRAHHLDKTPDSTPTPTSVSGKEVRLVTRGRGRGQAITPERGGRST
jgi:hypothetical protein